MTYEHLPHYFSGKRVFLTGHTGFKGTWLLLWLKELGATVKGYALAPETPDNLYIRVGGDQLCDSVIADIRDHERIVGEMRAFRPDYVFHLAAQPLVRLSYDLPAATFAINAVGTAHVLDGVRALDHSCTVVCVTTDKVYDNREWHYPYRESDRLGGYDPYSASKACAELIIDSYRNSFFHPDRYEAHGIGLASARAGNVIGGGDWARDRIVPDIVRALQANQPILIRNPAAVRPWQHVLEPIGAYLHLATRLVDDANQYGGSWNFGPQSGDTLTVKELVNLALSCWGSGTYTTPQLANQPHEAGLLALDIHKAKRVLGWQPKLDAATAVARTIDWYRNEGTLAYTQAQIREYAAE